MTNRKNQLAAKRLAESALKEAAGKFEQPGGEAPQGGNGLPPITAAMIGVAPLMSDEAEIRRLSADGESWADSLDSLGISIPVEQRVALAMYINSVVRPVFSQEDEDDGELGRNTAEANIKKAQAEGFTKFYSSTEDVEFGPQGDELYIASKVAIPGEDELSAEDLLQKIGGGHSGPEDSPEKLAALKAASDKSFERNRKNWGF